MHQWKLQDAKARLSEVIKEANKAPQTITLRGEPTAVLISIETYEKLVKPQPSFLEFMRNSPMMGMDLDLKRDPSLTREIDL